MPRQKHTPLPNLERLLLKYEYDPENGGIFKVGDEHIEMFVAGCWASYNGKGYRKVCFEGRQYMAHRLAYYMFHRKDPGQKIVDHINGDPGDNRIHNLRLCSPTANARNLRKKGKYVVDDDGVGRWVSGVVKT